MMTLKEVRKMVNMGSMDAPIPAEKRVDENILISKRLDTGTSVTVYKTGDVLYTDGRHSTVFRIPPRGDYTYDFISDHHVVEEDYLENENCFVRLVLEGEDRLADNQRKRDSNHSVLSYSTKGEDEGMDLMDHTPGVLDSMVCQETIDEVLQRMTEKQRIAVCGYYMEEMRQAEIAGRIGVSQQRVSRMIRQTVLKLKKELGADCETLLHI